MDNRGVKTIASLALWGRNSVRKRGRVTRQAPNCDPLRLGETCDIRYNGGRVTAAPG